MGNDGGSIPTRRELVKEAARDLSLTEAREKQKEHLAHRWSQCPLTHRALNPPIVADCSGDLYNKDGILQFLLAEEGSAEKTTANNVLQDRVKSLKDVVEVHFETEKDDTTGEEKWVCPITRKQLGVNTKAVFLVPCGHAFSHEAVREVKSSECIQCNQVYDAERDVMPILPSTDADKKFVVQRIETLRSLGLSHSLKKVKGDKKRKTRDNDNDVSASGTANDAGEIKKAKTGHSVDLEAGGAKSKDSSQKRTTTATTREKMLAPDDGASKKQYENENIASLYTKKGEGGPIKNKDFLTRGYTIPAGARHR